MDEQGTLTGDFEALIEALVAAHLLEPELNRIFEEEVTACLLPVFNDVRQRFYEAIKGVLLRHREVLTTPDIDLAAFVVQRMLKTLINAVVLVAPPGVQAASVKSEIVPAVVGYLTAKRSN